MSVTKTSLWLSVTSACLVSVASTAGIIFKDTYARETTNWAAQAISQDIVNLVAVVVLLLAAYGANRGSLRAYLVWSGALLYLLYAYSIYAFDVHFNRFFLVYVAILGLSFYALVSSVIHLRLNDLTGYFAPTIPIRLLGVFFLVLGALFYLLWLREDVTALLIGTIPPSVTQTNVPTNPVHVLDIGFYLPAMFITAWLLWRRHLWGYLLAGPLLVFSALMGTAILVIFLVTSSQGALATSGIEAFFAFIVVVSLALGVRFLRAVTPQGNLQ